MYYDSDSDSDFEEQENTPEELEVIYKHIGDMIDYVAKKYLDNGIYKYLETQTRVFIYNYYKHKLKIELSTKTLYDILRQYESDIQARVNLSHKDKRQQQYIRYIDYVRSIILLKAKNKTKITYNNLFKHPYVPRDTTLTYFSIKDEDKRKLYDEYITKYNAKHHKEPTPVRETFINRIDTYVGLHHGPNDMLNKEQFIALANEWKDAIRTKSSDDYYNIYLNKYYKLSKHIDTVNTKFDNTFGYKSKKKFEALHELHPELKQVDNRISSFPLKDNIKKYQVHKVAARDTYMIDLMFSGKLCYLVCINVNTRYLIVELMNKVYNQDVFTIQFGKQSKNVENYLGALQSIVDSGINIKHLIGDGEKAFDSRIAHNRFYKVNNIDFKPVPRQHSTLFPEFMKNKSATKTEPLHSALGIIDRVIRTIRDIAFNMKIDPNNITPNIMKEIVNQYNNVPHIGLSSYAGFDVTPAMVQNDRQLEDYIVRKICQCNYEVVNTPGYKLRVGTNVKVYNEKDSMSKRREVIQPGEYVVESIKNGLCIVRNVKNNRIQAVPRYKLAFA